MSGIQTMTVPVETAKRNFGQLLEGLHLGETITVVNSEEMPLALIIPLRPARAESERVSDWEARWDALAHKVSRAWKSDRGSVEILTEMRR